METDLCFLGTDNKIREVKTSETNAYDKNVINLLIFVSHPLVNFLTKFRSLLVHTKLLNGHKNIFKTFCHEFFTLRSAKLIRESI